MGGERREEKGKRKRRERGGEGKKGVYVLPSQSNISCYVTAAYTRAPTNSTKIFNIIT